MKNKFSFIHLIILCSLGFNQKDTINKEISNDTSFNKTSINQRYNHSLESPDGITDTVLFKNQMLVNKLLYYDAQENDTTGDTLGAIFAFSKLFESLAFTDEFISMDQDEEKEYKKFLYTVTVYLEEKSTSLKNIETEFSVALLKDKLYQDEYKENLINIDVDEIVEIIPGHIPITRNEYVQEKINFFSKTSFGKKSFQKWLNRMNKYKNIILPILEKEEVPPEIFYLSMIESGLNPRARSFAHAKGLWQFISSTGKNYDLKINRWVDERLDFEKSTIAATRYLKDLYKQFDDWYLAFAAYNGGEGRINKSIRDFKTRNIFEFNQKRFPKETFYYVPTIMAAIYIANNPEEYGFNLNNQDKLYDDWRVVKLDKSLSLDALSDISNVDIKTLKEYNPELLRDKTPPIGDLNLNGKIDKYEINYYSFRLPDNSNKDFDSLLVSLKGLESSLLTIHTIQSGENLTRIAKKYLNPPANERKIQAMIQNIVSLNNIPSYKINKLKIGTKLSIPSTNYNEKTKKETIPTIHFVRRGETLGHIARKYGTTVKKIKQRNGLRRDIIKIGQKLEIYSSNKQTYLPETTKIYYTVRRGDTLSDIASKYRTYVSKIKRDNNLKSNKIIIGQKLIINK